MTRDVELRCQGCYKNEKLIGYIGFEGYCYDCMLIVGRLYERACRAEAKIREYKHLMGELNKITEDNQHLIKGF